MTTIFVGADHRGFHRKEKIKEWLSEWGYHVQDMGGTSYDFDDDWTDYAIKVAENVTGNNGCRGILVCSSGIGVCIAANKVKGIRAATCSNEKQVRIGRNDDDINILCLSSELVDEDVSKQMIKTFLDTVFAAEERFIRRIKKVRDYENGTYQSSPPKDPVTVDHLTV